MFNPSFTVVLYRSAILAGSPDAIGDKSGGGQTGTSGEAGKRKVVYDAASNTRIVYRVVTPGELKKTATSSPAITVKKPPATPVTPAPTPKGRGTGRGRGRPGRPPRSTYGPARGVGRPPREVSDDTDSEEDEDIMLDDDADRQNSSALADMSKEEREGI